MSLGEAQAARSQAHRRPKLFALEPLAALLIARLFRAFDIGTLSVELPAGARVEFRGRREGPAAKLSIKRWRVLRRSMIGGDVGFAEAFMDGDWSTPDLPALLECMLLNEPLIGRAWAGFPLARIADRLRHLARANTRKGSRRNIEAHYDLGNDFYAAWLDAGMNYSSALYSDPTLSLEVAQHAKLDRAIALLNVEPGNHVLEIGCGWGALAERLATRHGASVTGITLSPAQLAYAQERMSRAGCADKVELALEDYRDVTGRFDAIISIEMLEAAGESYWPVYFDKLSASLTPNGVAVLQVITIEELRFAEYKRRPDFIQRHIFPGGMLPTIERVKAEIGRAGLALCSLETFGSSYALTLKEWRSRFLRAASSTSGTSWRSERFKRMWDYYLAYCEVGFRTKALDVGLYKIVKLGDAQADVSASARQGVEDSGRARDSADATAPAIHR
jgi:cyclopropane-fatty-acyl-phospholipid synthase